MSFINIRYGNVPAEIIAQGTAFCYSFAVGKRTSANAIQSGMRPLYGDKNFTRPVIHVWCKKFVLYRESVVDEVALLFSRPMQRSQRLIPSCGQTSV